jgi:hypothetical protein
MLAKTTVATKLLIGVCKVVVDPADFFQHMFQSAKQVEKILHGLTGIRIHNL